MHYVFNHKTLNQLCLCTIINSNFNFANTFILQKNDGIVTHYDSIYYNIVTISSFIELKIYDTNSSDTNVWKNIFAKYIHKLQISIRLSKIKIIKSVDDHHTDATTNAVEERQSPTSPRPATNRSKQSTSEPCIRAGCIGFEKRGSGQRAT